MSQGFFISVFRTSGKWIIQKASNPGPNSPFSALIMHDLNQTNWYAQIDIIMNGEHMK